jgi:hypothetical protein
MDNRLIRYLVINVIVSALTALLVLVVWNRLTAPELPEGLTGSVTATEPAGPTATQGDFNGQLAITSVIGAGSLESERARIEHVGDRDLSLEGWRLEDEDGNRYSFPALVLHPGAALSLFSRSGDDSVTELYWDRSEPIWESGEQAILIDPDGDVQAEYTVP